MVVLSVVVGYVEGPDGRVGGGGVVLAISGVTIAISKVSEEGRVQGEDEVRVAGCDRLSPADLGAIIIN